jgi:hypothetical protein
MAVLKATRGAQYPLMAEFKFTITDTMLDIAGVSKAFSAVAPVMDVIKLPDNAVVVGGDMTVETVSNETGTATIAVGDSDSATRYLAATSIKAAARTALTLTGYRGTGQNLRITLANQNGNATAGVVSVRVMYIIKDRQNEAQPN